MRVERKEARDAAKAHAKRPARSAPTSDRAEAASSPVCCEPFITSNGPPRCLLPAKARRSRQALLSPSVSQVGVAQQQVHGFRQELGRVGGHEFGRAAEVLGKSGGVRGDRWDSAGHRLKRREAEAFGPGGKDEELCTCVKLRQIVIAHVAGQVNAAAKLRSVELTQQRFVVPAELSGEHKVLGPVLTANEVSIARHKPFEILARLNRSDVQHVAVWDSKPLEHRRDVLSLSRLERLVDPRRYDIDAVRRQRRDKLENVSLNSR